MAVAFILCAAAKVAAATVDEGFARSLELRAAEAGDLHTSYTTPMHFEAKAALALGFLLPVLETWRRGLGHWRIEFTTMFEDYLAGALLLAGAWAAHWRHPSAHALLLLAWAWVTGMMTISFVDQVEVTIRGVDLEPFNTDVLLVKSFLLAISMSALRYSFRRLKELG